MKQKNAFTMAELTVCIIVMTILAVFAITNIKPNDNKIRLFVYAAMDNISSVIGTLVSDNIDLSEADNDVTVGSSTYDWLCLKMADYFSLKETANCSKSASESDVNLAFTNGVEIQGLASSWQTDTKTADDGTYFKFKEFVLDIDGSSKGMNKVGVDRFPLRIYREDVLEGSLIPVNCSLSNAGNYCKNSGTKTTVDLAASDEFISYDIYKPQSAEASKADMVATHRPYMEADCGIFGGLGYYTPSECSSAGYRAILNCVNEEICAKCVESSGSCPEGYTTASTCKSYSQTNNPDNIACFMMLSKPGAGAGILLDTVVETITE